MQTPVPSKRYERINRAIKQSLDTHPILRIAILWGVLVFFAAALPTLMQWAHPLMQWAHRIEVAATPYLERFAASMEGDPPTLQECQEATTLWRQYGRSTLSEKNAKSCQDRFGTFK